MASSVVRSLVGRTTLSGRSGCHFSSIVYPLRMGGQLSPSKQSNNRFVFFGGNTPSRHLSSHSLPRTPIFQYLHNTAQSNAAGRVDGRTNSTVVTHYPSGPAFSYDRLLRDVAVLQELMVRDNASHPDWNKSLSGQKIAFLVENGYQYVVAMLATLANDAVAVPLSPSFPTSELDYILEQSEARYLLTSELHKSKAELCERLEGRAGRCRLLTLPPVEPPASEEEEEFKVELKPAGASFFTADSGMMLYTSGTTNKPGVFIPQLALLAQVMSLQTAWEFSPRDHFLHVLPLHHIHGVVNGVLTPLLSGSSIEFMSSFNARNCWDRFAAPFLSGGQQEGSGQNRLPPITVFSAVPTIYSRLIDEFDRLSTEVQDAVRTAISAENLRLCMSGSAALPTPIMDSWTELSGGNKLLERYGMTETGMILSCGLAPTDRVGGSVGWPLPTVEVRLVDPDTGVVIEPGDEVDPDGREKHGEVQVRGPTVFQEYHRNPAATEREFTSEAERGLQWFKTGDIAVRRTVDGTGENQDQPWAKGPMYFIQGRKSADIIKTGGEKVSALEVEREMLALPEIRECAVVGIDSDTWGQKVAAVVVLTEKGMTAGRSGKPFSPLDLRRALKDRLAGYKIPQEMKVVDEIPRNAMGKINKKNLVRQVFGAEP